MTRPAVVGLDDFEEVHGDEEPAVTRSTRARRAGGGARRRDRAAVGWGGDRQERAVPGSSGFCRLRSRPTTAAAGVACQPLVLVLRGRGGGEVGVRLRAGRHAARAAAARGRSPCRLGAVNPAGRLHWLHPPAPLRAGMASRRIATQGGCREQAGAAGMLSGSWLRIDRPVAPGDPRGDSSATRSRHSPSAGSSACTSCRCRRDTVRCGRCGERRGRGCGPFAEVRRRRRRPRTACA